MITLDGRITINGGKDGVTFEVADATSGLTVIEWTMTPADFLAAAMGRLAYVHAQVEFNDSEHVGRKLEIDKLEFVMPECDYKARTQVAIEEAKKACPDGWEPGEYFGSQGSFFTNDKGQSCARTTIRRWVPVEQGATDVD